MPASEPTDPASAPSGDQEPGDESGLPESELRKLEETIDRLLHRLEDLAERARDAEEAHAELRRALSRAEDGDEEGGEPIDERLRRLSRENERLRGLLDRGRQRAERIRQRLVLLEDES
jgi:predicted RNase H-like nuclease (RuvC/YqgF family)